MKTPKLITCAGCGTETPRRGPTQKYCEPCSAKRDAKRKREWAAKHRRPADPEETRQRRERKMSRVKANGKTLSTENAESISWPTTYAPDLRWQIRTAVPFDYGYSKNAVWRYSTHGHVYMRSQARSLRDALAWRLKNVTKGIEIFEGKIWIDIFVQKPNHKGDAINVVDTVCDAVKDAIPVDDNWYSIRRLDWQVVKTNPRLFVGIGQEADQHYRICSHCGRELPLASFRRRKSARLGRGRACKECLSTPRKKTT